MRYCLDALRLLQEEGPAADSFTSLEDGPLSFVLSPLEHYGLVIVQFVVVVFCEGCKLVYCCLGFIPPRAREDTP